MDPDNPVVKLCMAGMQAEARDKSDEALNIFLQAWKACRDDYEACIAAHFLARNQLTHRDMLYWNVVALNRANAVGDDRVQGFYPSLYLNLGYSYELVGNFAESQRFYQLAASKVGELPDGPYREVVGKGVVNGCKRVGIQVS